MTGFDPIRCVVWLGLLAFIIAVYVWLFLLAWPVIENALAIAGSLSRCDGLSAAECIALAQGGK